MCEFKLCAGNVVIFPFSTTRWQHVCKNTLPLGFAYEKIIHQNQHKLRGIIKVQNVVRLDLKESHFIPGKKNYDRVKQCLTENVRLKMNFLIAWDPPEENICPSSIAAYLSERGHKVSLCQPQFSKQTSYNLKVPLLPESEEDTESIMEHVEWLGLLSIGADLESEGDNYVNSYECPLETLDIGSCTHMKWTGYFTYNQIHRLFDELRKYVARRLDIPWLSMYVQGFADSPVSWNLKEHSFYTDGDNNYIVYLKPDGSYWTCSYISSNKRPKHKINKP